MTAPAVSASCASTFLGEKQVSEIHPQDVCPVPCCSVELGGSSAAEERQEEIHLSPQSHKNSNTVCS